MCNQRVVEYICAFLWAKRRMIYVPTICLQLVLMMFFSSTHTQRERESDTDTRIRTCVIIYLLMSVQVGESVRTRSALCSPISDWPVRANRNQNSRKDGADDGAD